MGVSIKGKVISKLDASVCGERSCNMCMKVCSIAVYSSQVQCVCGGKWMSISVRVALRHKG